jgi:hypothetical protein
MISAVIIVPADQRQAVNAALELEGYGPGNLSVPMRGTVRVESEEQATHYGCHWWIGSDFDAVSAIVESVTSDAVIVHDGPIDEETTETRIGFELFDGQAGDYIYVPVDPRLIEGLTMGLGELATPGRGLPYAPIIEHPSEQAWPVLQLRGEDVVPISLAANSEPLVQVLEAFVQGNGLTAEERDGIVGAVGAMAGRPIRIADMIPPSWQPYIMDRATVEALGYFGGKADATVLEQFAAGLQSMGERTDRRIPDGDSQR